MRSFLFPVLKSQFHNAEPQNMGITQNLAATKPIMQKQRREFSGNFTPMYEISVLFQLIRMIFRLFIILQPKTRKKVLLNNIRNQPITISDDFVWALQSRVGITCSQLIL